jgi:hypothetical protein
LDRTNVVQSAISQAVCLTQCRKLGIVEPITDAPEQLIRLLQRMWADHGDFISKQVCEFLVNKTRMLNP